MTIDSIKKKAITPAAIPPAWASERLFLEGAHAPEGSSKTVNWPPEPSQGDSRSWAHPEVGLKALLLNTSGGVTVEKAFVVAL